MRYRLSKLIPMRFTSTYRFRWDDGYGQPSQHTRSTWWQWRDRIWRHRRTIIAR